MKRMKRMSVGFVESPLKVVVQPARFQGRTAL
jgi:hypothetical protein